MLNVKDFGAAGDGATSDTCALRRALAAGGEIYFPAGTYLTATLELKSHTKLHFAPGAKLLADLDKTDWIPAARDPESRHAKHPVYPKRRLFHCHLMGHQLSWAL